MAHWHALFEAYGPGPSQKLPVALDRVVLPEHAVVSKGMAAGARALAIGAPAPADAEPDEVYVASNPESSTDPSEENTTYSWPLDVGVTDTEDCVPVIL